MPLTDRKTSQPQPEEIRRSKNTATKSAVAKVVNVGDEQYVILPKGFWVSAEEVWIEALADGSLLIREKTRSAGGRFSGGSGKENPLSGRHQAFASQALPQKKGAD